MGSTGKNRKPTRASGREKKDIIYCIGDSHASLFSGKNESQPKWPRKGIDLLFNFKTYKVGPSTAYNLCFKKTKTKGREKLFSILEKEVPKKAHVMLCFGEIDCRSHIQKQAEKRNVKILDVVQEVVDRYWGVILEVKNFKKYNYNVSVWNVIPSSHLEDYDDGKYPTYGRIKERNKITKYFNNLLKKKCQEENIVFIDVFENFVDEFLMTKAEFYYDDIHLGQQAMPIIMKELKKYFNLD